MYDCFKDPIANVYEPFVQMAAELGADGVDFDYEEFWQLETLFKTLVKSTVEYDNDLNVKVYHGGGDLLLTKFKFARTSAVWRAAVNKINSKNTSNLGLSVPSGVVSMWKGDWWFGNLKGVMLGGEQPNIGPPQELTPYKDIFNLFGASTWNNIYDAIMPMTYDMGGGSAANECGSDSGGPSTGPDNGCNISDQVLWYIKNGYANYKTKMHVGFEVGRPAFPHLGKVTTCTAPKADKRDYQLPLTTDQFNQLVKGAAAITDTVVGGFYWELFKDIVTNPKGLKGDNIDNYCVGVDTKCNPNGYSGTINGNDVATGICKAFHGRGGFQ